MKLVTTDGKGRYFCDGKEGKVEEVDGILYFHELVDEFLAAKESESENTRDGHFKPPEGPTSEEGGESDSDVTPTDDRVS